MNHWFKTESARNLILVLAITLATAFVARPARAADIALQGLFAKDDDVRLFNVAVASNGSIDIRSYGYAGGQTSTGTVVPGGGFETILTLFDSSGNLLSENDDGAGVATDPSTGLAGDSRITATLNAGRYVLALTQYDNFARGNLAEGFVETGHPNFTADPNFTTGGPCSGKLFRDISGAPGRCRDGNWTVDFIGAAAVAPVTPVPEPSTAGLLLLSSLGFAWVLQKRKGRGFSAIPKARVSAPLALVLLFSTCAIANALGQPTLKTDPARTFFYEQDFVADPTLVALPSQVSVLTLSPASGTNSSLQQHNVRYQLVRRGIQLLPEGRPLADHHDHHRSFRTSGGQHRFECVLYRREFGRQYLRHQRMARPCESAGQRQDHLCSAPNAARENDQR